MFFHIFKFLSSFAPSRLCVRLCLTIAITSTMSLVQNAAADNALTPAEKADKWQLLFNGSDAKGWKNNADKAVAAKIEQNALNPHGSGGYVLVYDKKFRDFVLKCDVKMDRPFCNSGIFLRVGDL